MKKQIINTLALLCAVVSCFGSVSCSNESKEHSWKSVYAYDSHDHWLECEDCDEKKDLSSHVISSSTCEVCGYTLTPTDGVSYKLSDDNTYAKVIGYDGESTDVVVASVYEGAPVTRIDDHAFAYGNKLTSILLPNTTESIGISAFEGCTKLTKLVIPDSVRTIGKNALVDCSNITELTLPFVGENIDSLENSHIGHLFGCTPESHQTIVPASLKKVTITRATFIGEFAFRYCTNLSEVIIPRTVTILHYGAFYQCEAMKKIFIPNSVTMIQNYAFAYCYNITIYCELESQPKNWDTRWNYDFPVVWGSKE